MTETRACPQCDGECRNFRCKIRCTNCGLLVGSCHDSDLSMVPPTDE